jgi:hypothetical protein
MRREMRPAKARIHFAFAFRRECKKTKMDPSLRWDDGKSG